MSNELFYFILGAGLNLMVALLVVRFVYYPATKDKTYVFTFLAFNTVIYFVLSLLTSANLSVGVGFGLFAIFSVLRYRTDEMPIREMTYLFILIALPVMNSVMISESKFIMILVANGFILGLLVALEREWGFRFAGSKRVMYDRICLLYTSKEIAQRLACLGARGDESDFGRGVALENLDQLPACVTCRAVDAGSEHEYSFSIK